MSTIWGVAAGGSGSTRSRKVSPSWKKAAGGVGGEEGVEVGQGGVVRSLGGERATDEPAHEQIVGEPFFERRIRATVGPGTHDLGAHEQLDGAGGRPGAVAG